jgi:hypothetical protein
MKRGNTMSDAALCQAIALRDAGHAVNISVVLTAEGKREQVIILHYLTCAKCVRERGKQ